MYLIDKIFHEYRYPNHVNIYNDDVSHRPCPPCGGRLRACPLATVFDPAKFAIDPRS